MTLDTTLMADTTIRKSVYLPAERSRVWEFLTKSELLNEWFHPAEKDLVEGQDYLLTSQKDGDRMCWGRVEKAKPYDYMRWSFTVGPLNGAMTTVEWHLTDAPGGTCLTLEHSGLPTDAEGYGLVMALDKGWHGFLLKLHDMS